LLYFENYSLWCNNCRDDFLSNYIILILAYNSFCILVPNFAIFKELLCHNESHQPQSNYTSNELYVCIKLIITLRILH
jgi:hypothetical protein